MRFKVNIVNSAEDDLLEIYKYIYFNDGVEKADKIYLKLVEKISMLEDLPSRGHIQPELKFLGVEDFLEIHFKPFRIIYRIIKKEVFVLAILDGKRDMQKLLEDRLLRD